MVTIKETDDLNTKNDSDSTNNTNYPNENYINLTNTKTPTNQNKYFDLIHEEEDSLYDFPDETQQIYSKVDILSNQLVSKNSYETARTKSLAARSKFDISDEESFVYGESNFRAFSYLFSVLKKKFGEDCFNKGNGDFYDLGSVSKDNTYNSLIGSWTSLCSRCSFTSIQQLHWYRIP